jgi:hypothetical protein
MKRRPAGGGGAAGARARACTTQIGRVRVARGLQETFCGTNARPAGLVVRGPNCTCLLLCSNGPTDGTSVAYARVLFSCAPFGTSPLHARAHVLELLVSLY